MYRSLTHLLLAPIIQVAAPGVSAAVGALGCVSFFLLLLLFFLVGSVEAEASLAREGAVG